MERQIAFSLGISEVAVIIYCIVQVHSTTPRRRTCLSDWLLTSFSFMYLLPSLARDLAD